MNARSRFKDLPVFVMHETGKYQAPYMRKVSVDVRGAPFGSVIARLEDADYEGHSLSMLQRIAHALNQRLEIHLSAIER